MGEDWLKKYTTTLLFCFICFQANAQTAGNLTAPPIDNLLLKQIENYSNTDKRVSNNGIEGTPFLNVDFLPGVIETTGGNLTAERLRYNVYLDIVEFETNGQRMILDPNSFFQRIQIGEITLSVCNYPSKMGLKKGFLIELITGRNSLYFKKNMSIREAQPPKALQEAGTPAKYIELSGSYYLKNENDSYSKVSSIADIIKALPQYAEKLKSHAKNEKLSKKKEKDLLSIVKYANSL